jgi:hypothetical protein
MDFQAITHTTPGYPPGSASEVPGNGQYRVRLSTGGLRAYRDSRRVAVTAKLNIGYVSGSREIKAEHLIGKIAYGWVCLASSYY